MSLLLIIVINLGVGGFDQDMEDDMEEEEDEDILRQQQEEEEAARIEQEEATRIQQEEILRQQQREEQEAAQIQQEEILRQQQEEQADQIQGQQEHRVHVHFENGQQQHATSVTHFSSGQRFSPKASSNYEMSEKVRDSVLESMAAKRKHARSQLRRSNRVRAARDIFSQFVNQIAPSASEHQRERDVLDTLQGEFLSEIRYDFPPSEDQE
jgi:hypothetical protein